MKGIPENKAPDDADERKAIAPVICYPPETLPEIDKAMLAKARAAMVMTEQVIVPPRDARTFCVPKGHFFRIISSEGA